MSKKVACLAPVGRKGTTQRVPRAKAAKVALGVDLALGRKAGVYAGAAQIELGGKAGIGKVNLQLPTLDLHHLGLEHPALGGVKMRLPLAQGKAGAAGLGRKARLAALVAVEGVGKIADCRAIAVDERSVKALTDGVRRQPGARAHPVHPQQLRVLQGVAFLARALLEGKLGAGFEGGALVGQQRLRCGGGCGGVCATPSQ